MKGFYTDNIKVYFNGERAFDWRVGGSYVLHYGEIPEEKTTVFTDYDELYQHAKDETLPCLFIHNNKLKVGNFDWCLFESKTIKRNKPFEFVVESGVMVVNNPRVDMIKYLPVSEYIEFCKDMQLGKYVENLLYNNT